MFLMRWLMKRFVSFLLTAGLAALPQCGTPPQQKSEGKAAEPAGLAVVSCTHPQDPGSCHEMRTNMFGVDEIKKNLCRLPVMKIAEAPCDRRRSLGACRIEGSRDGKYLQWNIVLYPHTDQSDVAAARKECDRIRNVNRRNFVYVPNG